MTRLGHGRLSQFFDVWWLIAGGSVAQRPFGTAPLIGVKDPSRISLHTNTGQEEVVMPVDSILFSVSVIAILAFVAALFWADFQSRSL
jgi:hypothetical protein